MIGRDIGRVPALPGAVVAGTFGASAWSALMSRSALGCGRLVLCLGAARGSRG
jgi:hypothetical protein